MLFQDLIEEKDYKAALRMTTKQSLQIEKQIT